ncbi:MAG: relaxase domain-containing protein, partial [Candidatus Aenigmarchaeota archaeon]|nr:relaxase domain-containing protein [Candidatus Aenigmarchaeota archaeon]
MAVTIGQIYESLKHYEKDNYYLKGDVAPSKFGSGWEKLGNVEINEKTYSLLAQGKDPVSGSQLVDDRNGHRPGYNITFSPDKSFSVAAFSSPELKASLLEAHHLAVKDALSYLEKELTQARMGVDGEKVIVQTGNLVGFTINHQVNRDGDVQIHTHAVVFNMTYNEVTQKWQALHSDAFKSNVLEKIYENQLAHYLQEKGFAVEWKPSETGKSYYATIAGVPKEAIEATSHRAAEIKEVAEKLKEQYPNASLGELKQIAAYMTRPEKMQMTLEQIDKQFSERLQNVGLTKEDIIKGIEQAKLQAQSLNQKMNEHEIVKLASNILSEQKAVFGKQELIKAAIDIAKADVSFEKIERAINDFLNNKDLVKLADGIKLKDGNRTYTDTLFTTKENLVAEKNVFNIVEQGKGSMVSIYNKEQVLKEIQSFEQKLGYNLTNSQKEAIIGAMTSTDSVTVFQGYAGVGKTETLRGIKELAEIQGYKTIGLSETNTAVREMAKVDIEAYTVTKFLNSKELQNAINQNTIIAVDEASFMGAKNMEFILSIAQQKGARTYVFGDKNQLPPINAGFPFRDLQEKHFVNVIEMKDVIRQTNQTLKEAVEDIIKQDIDKAFEKLNVIELKEANIYKETAKIYVKHGGYKNFIVSTYTNFDRNVLNQEIRDSLKEQNIISDKLEKSFIVYTSKNLQGAAKFNIHNYNVGDKLVAIRSGAGVKVGSELTIKSVDYKNHMVTAEAVTKQGVKEYQIDIR